MNGLLICSSTIQCATRRSWCQRKSWDNRGRESHTGIVVSVAVCRSLGDAFAAALCSASAKRRKPASEPDLVFQIK